MGSQINLKVTSNFEQASRDLKEFGATTEAQRQKIEKFAAGFKTEQIDSFMDRNRRAAAAIKATQGPMASVQAEYRGLQREIQKLIRRGLDPQDEALKPLIDRYRQLDREMEDVEKQAKRTGSTFGALDGIILGLGNKVVDLAQEGLRRFIDYMGESIEAASAAQEINSKYAVTFDEVSASAEYAAIKLSESYGLAESSSKDLLANTGDLLTGLGATDKEALGLSVTVQELAADLVSFTNYSGGVAGASNAITKALLGEREMLKSLNIAIRESDVQNALMEKGLDDLTGSALQYAKAQETLNLIVKQSPNAINDVSRTWDSYANVARRAEEVNKALREEMGQRLMPAAGTLKSRITEIKEEMYLLIKANNDLQEALGKKARDEILGYADQIALAKQEVTELNTKMMEVAQGKLSLPGLKAVFGNLLNIRDKWEEIAEEQERNVEAVEKQYEVIRDAESITDSWLQMEKEKEEVIGRQEQYEKAITSELEKQQAVLDKTFKDIYSEINDILGEGPKQVDRIRMAIAGWTPAIKDSLDSIEEVESAMERLEEIGLNKEGIKESYRGLRALHKILSDELQNDLEEWKTTQGEIVSIYKDMDQSRSDAFNAAIKESMATREQIVQLWEDGRISLDTYISVMNRIGEESKEAAEAQREAFVDSFNAIGSAAEDMFSAIGDMIEANLEKEIQSIEESYEAYTATYEDLQNQYSDMAKIYEQLGQEETAAKYESLAEQQALIEDFTTFTAEQRAQMLEDAKKVGNEEVQEAIRLANERVRAEEKAERDIAQAEYEAALSEWQINKTQAIANTALAIVNAMLTKPFIPAGLIAAGTAGVMGGIQVAAIEQAKPEPPSFQTGTMPSGFIVPEASDSSRGDSQRIAVNPGERVDITPRGEIPRINQNISLYLDDKVLINWINNKIKSGEIRGGVNL